MSWQIAVINGTGASVDGELLLEACDGDGLRSIVVPVSNVPGCQADLLLVVLADCDETGEALFRSFKNSPVPVPVLAVLPQHASDSLIRLVAEVAADFLMSPVRREEIRQRIYRILGEPATERSAIEDSLLGERGLKQLVGRDPAFLRVVAEIPVLARSNRPVLVTGDTGTGKELCARALHHLGKRRDFPFIPIDCGAFPDQLFENEMFGHDRGAYTDAHREQRGLIALAEGGTLFLDEIDALSVSAQAKLLRFLQERTYRPLGGDRFVQADVNVIAATNRDLERLVDDQKFRTDLFFRLSVLRIHMIPLRERRDDIPVLARHFLEKICAEDRVPLKTLAPTAIAELRRQPWPGNVRELYNALQRACVYATGAQVLPVHINSAQTEPAEGGRIVRGTFRTARARAIEAFERQYVIEMLKVHHGNITQAARGAGQDRRAFGRLVKRHKIDRRVV